MKRALTIITALTIFLNSFASTGKDYTLIHASHVLFPVGTSGHLISLLELSKIKPGQLQMLTGKKMNIFDKLAFRSAQKKLRNHIHADGFIDRNLTKRWEKFDGIRNENANGFHAGGFFLGFLLGLIGLLIAYVINDNQKRVRVKWAWIGLAAQVALALILIAVGLRFN